MLSCEAKQNPPYVKSKLNEVLSKRNSRLKPSSLSPKSSLKKHDIIFFLNIAVRASLSKEPYLSQKLRCYRASSILFGMKHEDNLQTNAFVGYRLVEFERASKEALKEVAERLIPHEEQIIEDWIRGPVSGGRAAG